MLEFIFEVIFEFFGELILQLGTEWLGAAFRAGWLKVTGRERRTTPEHEIAWSVVTGILAGLLTLWFFPHLALRIGWLQALNIIVAPVAAGLLVERIRAFRDGHSGFRPAVFGYAALFGLAFALTRYFGGK